MQVYLRGYKEMSTLFLPNPGIIPRASHTLSQCLNSEPHPQPTSGQTFFRRGLMYLMLALNSSLPASWDCRYVLPCCFVWYWVPNPGLPTD